jgi:tetratricopeptide (TPR) repeat protein
MSRFVATVGTLAATAHGAVAAIADISQVSGGNLPQSLTLASLAALGLAYTAITGGRSEQENEGLREKVDALVRSEASDRDKAQQLIDLFNLPTDGEAANESAMVLLACGLKQQADQHGITLEQINAAVPKITDSLKRIEHKLDETVARIQQIDELEAKVEARYRDELSELRSNNSALRSALEFAQEQAKRGDQISENAIEQLRRNGDTEKLLEALIADRDRNQRATTERNRQIAEVAYLRGDIQTAEDAVEAVLQYDPNDWDALNLSALIHFVRGDLKEAESGFRRVLTLSSDSPASKAVILGNLGVLRRHCGDLAQAEAMLRESLQISEGLGLAAGVVNQCCNLGAIYQTLGRLDDAEGAYKKGLAITSKHGLIKGAANLYCCLGILFKTRGNFLGAEEMYKKSLAAYEDLGDKLETATVFQNLGVLYKEQSKLEEAKRCILRSLEINREIGHKHGIAANYSVLGQIGSRSNNPIEVLSAKDILEAALEINRGLSNKEGMASDYANLGNYHLAFRELDSAEDSYAKAMELLVELGHKEGIGVCNTNLANIYRRRGNLNAARRCLIQSRDIYAEIGVPHRVEQMQEWLAELDAESPKAPE